MNTSNTTEKQTQDRVIKLFSDELGYEYLGNWAEREGNSNVEELQLKAFLEKSGYSAKLITKALAS